ISAFHATLIELMKAKNDISFEQRMQRLQKPIEKLFNVAAIGRISTGRFWHDFSAEERERLLAVLTRLILANYASRFQGYSGQQFETLEVLSTKAGQTLVKTRIVNEDKTDVPINYFFRGEQVYNVVADGVSDLSLRRAEYTNILKQKGLAELINDMEKNIRSLAAK
ncbi:MAG: ABC transporter substrate-binding protein, partial [Pseudomonadales bacterium]